MAAKVPVKQYEFSEKKVGNMQAKLEEILAENYKLNKHAKEAYRSYILSYNSHSVKDIFNIHRVDLQDVAASFGLSSRPMMNLNLNSSASKFRRKTLKDTSEWIQ